ncbi:sodium/glutamate symporter [Nisaea acidiphila]|uniref:Sodium/glutamate symporter n=1 Tax=Nisaea acidiphila TaxID=1862145 RepID=A0A9J7AWV6_9PROT|nr:sodium/glutamate symporter [Nisaea acidiphila]UUX51776.1 sodium/glutamate symporter [Nisaea acidiphila]
MLEIPAFPTVTIGIIVFFLGAMLTRRVGFLKSYNIPEPVSGGLVVAFVIWLLYLFAGIEVVFDLSARDEFLVIFFATVGLNARLSDLARGGRLLAILLGATFIFIVAQNAVGLLGAVLFDLPKPFSVLIGSASLIGGHGTAIAWGPTIGTATGVAGASEIGIAAATLGLVSAALIGGPIAHYLIGRHGISGGNDTTLTVGMPYPKEEEDETGEGQVNHITLMRVLLWAHIAVIVGYFANKGIAEAGLKLPLFVPCLLTGIVLANTVPLLFPSVQFPARTRSLAIVSDYALSIFLAMSLMSIQLWTLAGLGGPLVTVLVLQILAAAAFIVLIFFRVMGKDYTAAVLSAGFAGFTLGATPTAMANMSSVTKHFGPAPLAFIVLPLVSAFFVDLANAFVIGFFVGL